MLNVVQVSPDLEQVRAERYFKNYSGADGMKAHMSKDTIQYIRLFAQ